MVSLVVEQAVLDADRWREEFHRATEARRAAAAGDALLLEDTEHAGQVVAVVAFASADQALAWRYRPPAAEQLEHDGVDAKSVRVRIMRALEVLDVRS